MDESTNVAQDPQQADGSQQPDATIERTSETFRSEQETVSDTTEAEPSKDNNSEQAEESVDGDDDLKQWAKSKGIDPDDPNQILKLARDTEKGFRQYSQKAKQETNELKQKISTNPDYSDSDAVIQEARVINFYNSNPDAKKYDVQMGEIYGRFQEKDPEFANHLLRHLDTLYAMARNEDSTVEIQAAREQGRAEALQKQKKAQAASSPQTNAVSSAPPQSGWTPERVDKVIAEGKYNEHREEILAWERSQIG